MSSEHRLQRFIEAQEATYPLALAEIQQGKKRSHWMWYIFPQLQGLGYSTTSQYYGLQGAQEAEAYVQHALLGPRLLRMCEALLSLPGQNATHIMGSPDDIKLRSSMTLFAARPAAHPVFQLVLNKFFKGMPDQQTLRLLDP